MYSIKGILHNSFVVKKAYDSLWEGVMQKYKLTRAEIDVLAFIANNPELNIAHKIVEYRMIAKSHVSKAVDNLLERGYLIREKDKNDQRCIHLILTNEANGVVADILENQREFAKKLVEGFTEDELLFFTKMTCRVASNAEKMM